MMDEKCDHCHRTKYPTLFHFKFFGRKWALCPGCCRALGVLMKHKAATIVQPIARRIIPAPARGTIADLVAARAGALRRSSVGAR